MAKLLVLFSLLFGLLLLATDASRNTQPVDKEGTSENYNVIVEGPREGSEAGPGLNNFVTQQLPGKHGLQDTYCCRKDAFGSCLQECDSGVNYYCCLKNGLGGCLQLCDSSKKHYCCKKNPFGTCLGMCPKTLNLMDFA
ncbi:hypothetical protein SELMODRAFT_404106 [Selaginella moellendorffii]|uniref:Uncharacterized protein n=1 Tax=Selaginella moellendorffii TaxID=88036 RepID=D8QUA8_SELML|nr:uncharacterized protein LOC9661801 isoform X3 [Selaginella moellendorffii]EFJ35837.1 hypothetical protein SELMODRAFT_404106 [Selaginella moellendorffii]|eukprot:XP_002962374.1 uncharacterized protein LOC9661801 isoform X3 [Selaginella moellendorffii]